MTPLCWTRREFRYEVEQCREKMGKRMGPQIRAMSLERIVQELTGYTSGWMLLEEAGTTFCCILPWGSWSAAIPPLIGTSGERRNMIRWKMNKLIP